MNDMQQMKTEIYNIGKYWNDVKKILQLWKEGSDEPTNNTAIFLKWKQGSKFCTITILYRRSNNYLQLIIVHF